MPINVEFFSITERTRDKKQRQNRQLRKSMLPKNALMALNEVKGVTISDFTIDSNADGGFTAIVTVNSNQYEGKGLSKMSAKNAACEKAWRDFIIAKMTPKPTRSQPNEPTNGVEPMDTNEDEGESPEDDLPMLNLASFAIYKLFAEWEREGYVVPEMHPNSTPNPNSSGGGDAAPAAPAAPKEPKKPPIRSDLPPNWETMHPATILCIVSASRLRKPNRKLTVAIFSNRCVRVLPTWTTEPLARSRTWCSTLALWWMIRSSPPAAGQRR